MGGLKIDKVSVIIPGRNEIYFQQTIDSCLKSAVEDIEVIAVVDGYKPNPPLVARDSRVKIIQYESSIGQRAGYNLGVKNSTGKYVMKIDAHAIPSHGFDKVLKSHCPDKTIVLPEMRRLDVKAWKPKRIGKTHFMYFGLDVFCHYWKDYKKRPQAKVEYPEVLTGQGSCWFTTREWNDYIGLLDEALGSWGKVGIEVSLKTWLCGGRQIVNKKAWQAHWFRVGQGGFPYPMSGRQIGRARDFTWDNFFFKESGAFPNQVRSFNWLMKKFAPIPSWETYLADEFKAKRVIVYYTDNRIEHSLAEAVRNHLKKVAGPIPIISVSQKPLNFGKNICVGVKERTYKSMYEQMLVGVEAAPDDSIIYLCEHDVFYHYSHFVKTPKDDCVYINQNKVYWKDGYATFCPSPPQKAWSMAVGKKDYLVKKFANPDGKGVEVRQFRWKSERPNIDMRHSNNFTDDPNYLKDWLNGKKEISNLPGWGSPGHFKSAAKYKGLMRFDIIQFLIQRYEYSSYLEIGVDRKHTFDVIECELKHGVDPNKNCTFKMTSDEFFKQNENKYDIVFVDGLHEADQVKRDIENALNVLTPGGVVVVHDCSPRDEKEQAVPKLKNQKIWIGDGWKAFVALRRREDLDMYVIDANNGVGIIRYGWQKPLKIESPKYKDFESHRKEWLNLKSITEYRAYENAINPIKKYKPMSEKMMNKEGGRAGTICETIRNVYHKIDNKELRYQLRIAMAMAKSMHRRLKAYKGEVHAS